ncbi:MAG TPA: DUF1800 domain-containing protein [Steroidobacteraceae bacterium]|jgi:uncharacterized protein (DUF1800 family)|nr:DUF1800 domain-containing protein [Steroidobacteraceae bacterium]
MQTRTLRGLYLAASAALTLAGCAASPPGAPHASYSPDIPWLERLSFGVNSQVLAQYQKLGRSGFLESQLQPTDERLPDPVARELAQLPTAPIDAEHLFVGITLEQRRINALPEGAEKQDARKRLNDQGNQAAYEARRRELLRALYSPAQLKEQMVWFWLNHFSVFEQKGNVRWMLADYSERAIRPHALGHFRDLVMATLRHPAMLQYLDNAQNAVGHINENYARELMELHTLGVDGGYSQHDVQELARVLTGVGVAGPEPPKVRAELRSLYRREGGFEFNPGRHDFGSKVLLGHTLTQAGMAEVAEAVTLLVHQPACARFVSRKLAVYFVGDDPPAGLVERMAQTFQQTDGDIAAVLRTLFTSRELAAQAGRKFKDPMQYVVSALRMAYDTRLIQNTHPVTGWLGALGEPEFGHQTPDGYSLQDTAWSSSGQMSRRFEIARAIGSGSAGLFDPDDGSKAPPAGGFPLLTTPVYYGIVEPTLSMRTHDALQSARSQQEWNLYLLASPDFNYR